MYISMSGNAKNAFLNGDKQYCHMASSDGTTYDIDEDRIIQGSMSINSYVTTNESISFGSCVASEMNCVLNNYDGHFNNIDLMGMEFLVSFGVSVPLGSTTTIEYVPIGYYIVDEVTVGKNTITISALDRMVKFDVPVNASALTFPCTTSELVTAICTACGVTCSTTLSGLPNASLTLIGAMPEETKTYRDLLHWACEIIGVNAFMSRNGLLSFKWYTKASSSIILSPSPITVANRTQSTIDTTEYEITGVTIIADNVKTSAGTTVRPIIIQDNPLIVPTDYQTVASALNTAVNGTTYHPFTAVTLPNPEYDCMDIVKFTKDGTDYWTQITEITYKLNGNSAMACGGDQQVKGRSYGLQDATLYAGNIAAGAITTDKLAAGAITADKISTTVDMATNAGVASTYATKTDAVKREQVIFRKTSTTSTPSTPTSWITRTADSSTLWTTRYMAYDTTYKYLWRSVQREYVDGTISCSTPVRDYSITVIDGGNILTGTVTADQIYVTDLETLDATIGGWNINETNIASDNNAVVLDSSGTISVTETGSDATGAKVIAETSNHKAYYSAYGARIDMPPNRTGYGTTASADTAGFSVETTAANSVSHGAFIADSASPTLRLYEKDASEEWQNNQTSSSIAITHKTGSTTDKSFAYGNGGVVQSVDESGVRYEAGLSPKASTPGGTAARAYVKQDNSLITADALSSDAAIKSHASKIASNNVEWYTDALVETTDTESTVQVSGHQGAVVTAKATNNLGNSGASGFENASISLETSTTAVTGRNDGAEAGISVSRVNNTNSATLRLWNSISGTGHLTTITPQTLKIDGHDLLRMTPHFAQMFATEITGNANLNTTTYLKCGQYYCQTTTGFTNIPTGNQFVMEVTAMIRNRYDDESETADAYRVRKITDYVGNQFIQYCSKPTNGSWSYGTWQKIITGADSVTELSSTGNITTSTSMAYTGKSLTLPSAGWWAIEGYASYSNAAPVAIAINREVGSYYYELAYADRHAVYDKTVQYVRTSCVGYYDANSVIKLFARYSGANSNGVGLIAKKLH